MTDLGVLHNFSSDRFADRVVVRNGAAKGSTAGKIEVGDVLTRARDASGIWEGFEEMRTGLQRQGQLGTKMTLALLRNGEAMEAALVRGWVEGFDNALAESWDLWKHSIFEEAPDLHIEISQIMGAGDLEA